MLEVFGRKGVEKCNSDLMVGGVEHVDAKGVFRSTKIFTKEIKIFFFGSLLC